MQALSAVHALAVAGGAAAGALLRWQAGLWLNGAWSGFPLGTLLVNCAGGLLIGMAACWFSRTPDEFWRLLLVTGFLGGLTTFSAFSAESLQLLQTGRWGLALGHSAAHVVGGLSCAAIGFKLVKSALI
ncbi:fluoride efflux transporter CrcB [Aquabacterium sp. A7-Y]|uniref:fluoride efflux transporter CrcB n=1 Tax=Aquabacterium sp. A7-Y TaxID=1349605 RepID=UPI00223D332F|nr:fluoride efflux transporter CrcB [Aquabacterium sp. A7-Y]MCW7541325.1 fluoride efflux transporter CrcB [Aquabacterium sp. A7-Y]